MAFERRTHAECLDELTRWIEEGKPFMSLRLTDGELWAMYRYRPPTDCNADGNVMSPELGDAIRNVIDEFAARMLADPNAAIQFGTTMFQHPDETTKWLAADMYRKGVEKSMRWINGHDMLDGVVDGRAKRLMQALALHRKVMLCGDAAIRDARHCLDAPFFSVPKPNAWLSRHIVLQRAAPFAQSGYTFVWCCGMGMKPVAWELFKRFPQSSHLDAGHIFDGAFGLLSREWLRNKEAPWYEPYMMDFKPFVLDAIPKE